MPARPAIRAVAALMLAPLSPLRAQEVSPARVAASLQRIYGEGIRADTLRPSGEPVLRVTRHDTLVGWAEVRNIKGKDQPITFLVATDTAGVLRDVDILVYREPYGGEVAYEAWRRQFRGKTAESPLTVGRDIRNISGATISSHAVTLGVRRAARELADWRGAGLLQ